MVYSPNSVYKKLKLRTSLNDPWEKSGILERKYQSSWDPERTRSGVCSPLCHPPLSVAGWLEIWGFYFLNKFTVQRDITLAKLYKWLRYFLGNMLGLTSEHPPNLLNAANPADQSKWKLDKLGTKPSTCQHWCADCPSVQMVVSFLASVHANRKETAAESISMHLTGELQSFQPAVPVDQRCKYWTKGDARGFLALPESQRSWPNYIKETLRTQQRTAHHCTTGRLRIATEMSSLQLNQCKQKGR